jgi:hypothetical protein
VAIHLKGDIIMSNYTETKKALDKIRSEYGCKGEVLFRTAIQYVVDCGQQHFQDEAWVKEQLEITDKKHDAFDREKKTPFMSREFEKAIIECAAEIAKVNTYELLVYIQKEVWLSNEGGISDDRAVELLKACMSNIEMWNDCQNTLTLHEFEDIGFDDDEIIELNFGYLLSAREDEAYDN